MSSKCAGLCYGYAACFRIPYDNYQYVLAYLGLWHISLLSHIFTYPQSISSYLWSSPLICTRFHALNGISVCSINTCKHNHHVLFLSFQTWYNYFPCPYYHNHSNFLMFIFYPVTRNRYVDAFQLLPIHLSNSRLNCFVEVPNCFVDAFCFIGIQFNSFGK